jgi:molecular chaperone HtpG
VVETSDLPLNISREMLQSNTNLEKIKKWLTKKVLEKLKAELKDNSNYDNFLKNYWKILKEWIYYDNENKEKVAEVIKFKSFLKWKNITLDEYLEEQKVQWDKKKEIYYITGKSESEVLINPYLEQFKEKNIDVLLLTDPIDEWIISSLTEYKESKLLSITASEINLETQKTPEENAQKEEETKTFKDLLELIKNTIWTDKLEEVKLNDGLWSNIWALKTKSWNLTPQMEKMMKAMWQQIPTQKRIFEINPKNEISKLMLEEFKKDLKWEKLKDLILFSYEQAVLLEGWELSNMKEFLWRVSKFIK